VTSSVNPGLIFDIAGIGFGPSNLALAIAVSEQARQANPITAVFLERQPKFGWHRGMLLENATMQVSFLKDLVTLRNPVSPFSFLSYLHEKGRLLDFINHKSLFPLRIEFHDYLEWAAAGVSEMVRYGHEVTSVTPVIEGDTVAHFEITSRGQVLRARNIVFATGLRPSMPEGIESGERIWHSSELLAKVDSVRTEPSRVIVAGAGQSAAEVTSFLHERFRRAEVCAVFSRYGYSPADDSPFANRVFDPGAVDEFYHAPREVKQMMTDYHRNTNYSVVDTDLINELYRVSYQEKVLGAQRLYLHKVSRLVEADEQDGLVRANIESLLTGEKLRLDADILVCATGYRQADPTAFLGPLASSLRRDEQGRLLTDRDYRLQMRSGLDAGIYLQGGTEHSHGITSSLLSNTAVRAGEILGSVRSRRAQPAHTR
jgi:L-ornithine N5-oxygenase